MNHFSRSQTVAIILVSILLLCFLVWRQLYTFRDSEESPQLSPMGVVIQVSGQVRQPGIYSLSRPVSVIEVLTRAGGLTSGLKPEPQWATQQVTHGRLVHITSGQPNVAHLRLGWMEVPSLLVLGLGLDVNEATTSELAQVPGVSLGLAERIVAYRSRVGGFSRLEELVGVKGIGPVGLERLRRDLRVDHSIELRAEGSVTRN
ncbi:MAG: helix-hairpin-helix domain-containing protein [Deltaproteobacteria bacterium]|nr:MAG: helix-hairpin-helix domain-containing protein [Deltaproteobacteria bacterium]